MMKCQQLAVIVVKVRDVVIDVLAIRRRRRHQQQRLAQTQRLGTLTLRGHGRGTSQLAHSRTARRRLQVVQLGEAASLFTSCQRRATLPRRHRAPVTPLSRRVTTVWMRSVSLYNKTRRQQLRLRTPQEPLGRQQRRPAPFVRTS